MAIADKKVRKFSIAVSENNLEDIEKIALYEDRSRNWIINKAIEMYLENYNKEGNK